MDRNMFARMMALAVAAWAWSGTAWAVSAPKGRTVLDDLMPAPKSVAVGKGELAAAKLRNVTVAHGAVPGAPAATADEAYVLEIGKAGVKIVAPGPFGEIWARVTLDQLARLAAGGAVPCCRIVDWPRLKWRGFMLDTVRNYLPPQGVKDVIDMMSRYKLNLFHWHLTENYAWRLESKRFPQLQSERAFLHRHKGKFYTQEEFKDIADYAYARGVRLMPEFDFPGHALAFRRAFGFKTMSDPRVADVASALFEELCALASKEKMPFVHMGTDEVYKRDLEGAPKATLERMAKAIADGGRTMVSWVPGETYGSPGPRVNMLWTDKVSPDRNPGPYFDAIGMYIEDFDPFELLSVAVYHKAARWHDAGDLNQGAIFCAWHDGAVGLPYENLLRNQPIFPSCVLFGNAYWNGRASDLPQFRKCLPRGGDPLLAEATDVERRVVAQRDRALRDLKHPFHFLRQTDMRWRLTQLDGTLIAKDIAQATINPGRLVGADGKRLLSATNGTVVAETWIKSPVDRKVGAWIGFTNISRDHGLVYTAPLPDVGEWNRFGASVEVNGERIAPPKWKRPGLKKGKPIADWTPAWTLYEADEEPFTDQEYYMREPTPITLRKGWNHVKLTMPNPAVEGPRRHEQGKIRHRWSGTFIPVGGTTDHPREIADLEYASVPPPAEAPRCAEVKPLVVEGAPFELTVQEWTPPARDFPITAYGAKPDGTAVTEAIEAAIDAAAKAGGGRVVVPKGEWISGAFKLKSGVALIVSKDALLHFPDDPVLVMRAPLRPDGRPTMTHGALIGATDCTNVAIMGEGTIKSDVTYWHDNFMKNPQRGWGRPQAINFLRCKNVRLEGFKVRGSPAWTMHLKICEDIVMRGVDSVCTGPNTDGLDLESCNRALVENCSLDQTDDTYTIKSGFNEAGRKRNIPTQNVVIRNCRAVHGHTLLGIGSEVSGGIRNIYMTDCTVEAECWRFLFVKTNCKRGAFVENVWMENIRGVSAPQAVFETEMYYDGNPNKELTKKGGPTWPTRISNIHVKNVTCAEAGYAVKVRGDAELPPKGLHAENIRIGKLRYGPVKAVNAPELEVKNVREDPAALREILDVPPQVRLMDPARDADAEVAFVRDRLEELSFNEINRRICEGRIAAETARGRNVAPRVTPVETPAGDVTFSGVFSRRIGGLLQDFSCAVSNAWIADDVRQVARAGADGRTRAHPGVTFAIKPDLATGDLAVTIVNGGKTPLVDLWCVVHLPPERMTRRHTFRAAKVPPGGKFERTLSMGAGAHYLPRPVGPSLYAAEIDFTRAGTRSRVWTTAEAYSGIWHPNLNATALHAGPLDAPEADDETLRRLSAETGPLPPLGDHPRAAWKSPAFPGAAWYNVAPASRPYTPEEKRLIYAGRACEVVALQFDVPTNTTTILRNTAALWTRKAMLFLNGERIPLAGKTPKLPVKVGFNRLLVKYPCRPGEETACLQLSVYPWDASTCWPCVPFPKSIAQSAAVKVGDQVEFPLEWNVRHAAGRPYEVEISTEKLARLAGVKKGTGFAVRAETPQGAKELDVATLPGKVAGTVDLRFTVPDGTTALTCRPAGALKLADPQETDNLFAGILADTKRWTLSPRMIAEPQADGSLLFRPRSGGSPEATCTIDVPPGLAGQPVKFEAILESLGGASWTLRLNIQQLDAQGERLPEPVYDRRWTTLMMPPGGKTCPFAELGRIHPEARKLRLFFSMTTVEKKYDEHGLVRARPAEALTKVKFSRLALRPAEQLPFPKYDDTYFAAGVSGQAGDCAIRLGGADERAFWYQTRSMASWNENIQLRKENQLFFPAGAGTVEAWFKSDWKPTKDSAGAKGACLPIVLFQAYQSFRAHECKGGKGAMLQLAYRPEPGTLELVLVDMFKTKYEGKATRKLPAGEWCHLAVQWAPGGTAEVFVDGRKKLTVPIPNWKALDLADPEIKVPNDENALEFYLGSTWQSARAEVKTDPAWPLYQGAADLLRVSTGRRYAGDFTPARAFACDADTRALFSFDRVFDGTSGGGAGWISGTTRALSNGRVARQLEIGGRKVQYTPKHVPAELDPRIVFDVVNFPVLPTAADFETARRPFTKSAVLKNGETLSLDCPDKVVTDFVEIANVSDQPLSYPIVLNAGDVDPRSCGDLADTLGLDGLDDRARVNRVFAFVLASTDYFMNHTAMFPPGSDTPRDVEYYAMLMLNGYCGFECGPLNNMTANLFVNVARCPASLTAGYGHSFEQVFYDGKNHIYDLSAQKYFPAMDNETAAYLEEGDNECGIFPRMGNPAEHFMRKSTRGIWVGNASCDEKIGVTLNPGEAFRVWQVNDGHCNDLMARTKLGVYKGHASKFRPDYTEPCHADTEKIFLQRTERFFPQYLNGFITFDGAPSAANPAFGCATNGTFCYKVASGGYPIVHAEYAARRRDGSHAELELSTDGGKTFRPFVSPADYAVRARYAYLIRVKAPMADVARFAASTEVQLNPRIYPGRLKAGANSLTFKCASDGAARVTVQGRVPAGRIAVPAAVSSGAIVGAETLFYAFDPAESPVLDVEGVSSNATVKTFGGLRATLKDGKLALAADKAGGVRMTAVRLIDNGAEKTMAVLVGTGVRLGTARQAKVSNRAKMLPPDAASPQARGWLPANNHEAEIAFPIAAVPAGKYAVMCLNRFESHPEEDPDNQVRMLWGDMKSTNLGRARNWGCNYKKANYGRPGERAQFKWDYAFHPGTGYPYANIRVAELPAADRVAFRSWRNNDAVEIAAVLVVPDPSMDLRGELTRVLCGLNCDPWRIASPVVR